MVKFIIQSMLLGVGLAMDAFSVSIANAMREPRMRVPRMAAIAGVYAFFQFLMPMTGWFCVRKAAQAFKAFQPWIPWIALALLAYIGGKMLLEGIHSLRGGAGKEDAGEEDKAVSRGLTPGVLFLQGVATSIDALSVGFTIEGYTFAGAFSAAVIIAAVTFGICMVGLTFGRRFGELISDYADIAGGLILMGIGIEVFVSHL